MEKQKRERSVNFTQEETDLLVSLAEANKHIIENKKSDATTWKNKEKAWKDIEKAFNSSSGSVFRDHKHLKLKYEAIKRDTRKKSAVIRAERYKTGGGTNTVPVFTPAEEKVKEMIRLSVEGNESCSDLVSTNSSKTIVIEIQEQDNEPPRKKVSEVPQEDEPLQCESQSDSVSQAKYQFKQRKKWNPTALKTKKHPVFIKKNEKRLFDTLTEEKIEIARIQKQVLTEELEQKLIQRKILEKELQYKDVIHELEKQHLLLKIELLKKDLRN